MSSMFWVISIRNNSSLLWNELTVRCSVPSSLIRSYLWYVQTQCEARKWVSGFIIARRCQNREYFSCDMLFATCIHAYITINHANWGDNALELFTRTRLLGIHAKLIQITTIYQMNVVLTAMEQPKAKWPSFVDYIFQSILMTGSVIFWYKFQHFFSFIGFQLKINLNWFKW